MNKNYKSADVNLYSNKGYGIYKSSKSTIFNSPDILTKLITLFLLFSLVELVLYTISQFGVFPNLDVFHWSLFALASFFGGQCISFLDIGEWIRSLFGLTKYVPHSSGAGGDNEPTYKANGHKPFYYGILEAIGLLICCPICSGVWTGLFLLVLLSFKYIYGMYVIYLFSIGAMCLLLNNLNNLLTWNGHYYHELTGKYNRLNKKYTEYQDN